MVWELKMVVMITSVMFQGTSVNLHLLRRIATSKKMKENSNLHYISMSTVPATLYKSCPHPQRDTKFQIEAEAQRSRSRNCPWWVGDRHHGAAWAWGEMWTIWDSSHPFWSLDSQVTWADGVVYSEIGGCPKDILAKNAYGHMFSFEKLNFKASLFSCIFWLEHIFTTK